MEILKTEESASLKNLISSILSRAEYLKKLNATASSNCRMTSSTSTPSKVSMDTSETKTNLHPKYETSTPISPIVANRNKTKLSQHISSNSPTSLPLSNSHKLRPSEIDVLRGSSIINGKVL